MGIGTPKPTSLCRVLFLVASAMLQMWRQLGTIAVGWDPASVSGAGRAQFGEEGQGYRGEDVVRP